MVDFIFAGIYSLILFLVGYLAGNRRDREEITRVAEKAGGTIKATYFKQPPESGGPIKAITKKEKEMEKEKGFIDKLKDYLPIGV